MVDPVRQEVIALAKTVVVKVGTHEASVVDARELPDISLQHLDKLWQNAGKGFKFDITGDKKGGKVVLHAGDKTIELSGDDNGGNIHIESPDGVTDISGDESGGAIETQPAQTQPN